MHFGVNTRIDKSETKEILQHETSLCSIVKEAENKVIEHPVDTKSNRI
jgi:hypothetical protein